ncbi:hypothetical protein V1264_020014 [Littorina saxatilis]
MTSLVTSKPLETVDLTYVLGKDAVFWPGQPPFNFTIILRGRQPGGYWFEVNAFGLGEHGGTHFDAPAHFVQGGWRAHQIPSSRLVGPGVVVNVADKVKGNAEYELTTEDLMNWEEEYGRIPDGAVVLMNSGWGSRYPDLEKVFNTKNPKDPTTFRFPGVHRDAARWLAEERNITALGVDFPSPDTPRKSVAAGYPVHTTLLGKDILILENVAYVNKLPPRGATIIIGTVKLQDGSGGPARILGLLGIDDASGSPQLRACRLTVLLMVLFSIVRKVVTL